MKKKLILLTLLLAICSFADCTIYAPRKVLCRNDKGIVSNYLMVTDSLWKAKTYYPEDPGNQTEATTYSIYKLFNMKALCLVATAIKAVQDSIDINSDITPEIELDCENKQAAFLAKIEQGINEVVPAFDLALGKLEKVSVMYCMNPGYVRTFKYNKVTQLETDRQDYQFLKPGTYCQDFLMDKKIYWKPEKDMFVKMF
ncbi:hypothetical protein [Fibrobacter succinogenes]|uniref:hypothetical protein n=1 Tax=Fibrobacter succinogenes TaxID=833 RepID=UPI0015692A06|nr:hypothetical protein [Fibrobacter succinogenes]